MRRKEEMIFRFVRLRSRFTVRRIIAASLAFTTIVVTIFLLVHFNCDFPKPPEAKIPEDEPTCIEKYSGGKGVQVINFHFNKPSCDNIINNMVKGKWVSVKSDRKPQLNALYDHFMIYHEGFSVQAYRSDGKCGFNVKYTTNPYCLNIYNDVSAWCKPNGLNPCCSDINNGKCEPPSHCLTPNSVNLSQYKYAEISDWVPNKESCKIVSYDQPSACSLLHQKKVKSIGFVGNSHMRNFYSLLIQLLTNNFYNGTIKTCVPPSIRSKCVNEWQNVDKYCLALGLGFSSSSLHQPICNGQLQTHIYFRDCFIARYGYQLKDLVTTMMGVEESYLFVGIGVHDKFDANLVFNDYLKPAVEAKKKSVWPKIVWVDAPKPGIFKPVGYTKMHGDYYAWKNFVTEMHQYCEKHNVMVLDISDLTTSVWSIDGQHYTSGVNLMKVQFLLNLLAADQIY